MSSNPAHRDLPRTTDVAHPATRLLTYARPAAQRILRSHFRLEVVGRDHVPAHGPVVLSSNHIGIVDGPMLAILSPRPVYNLTKVEMFRGCTGRFLHAVGQIPVERSTPDVAAVRAGLRVLRDGNVLGVFPEGTRGAGELELFESGAAYFALATGAPVVPVIFLGTRLPGGTLNSIPPRGSRVVITYGPPMEFTGHGWPRRPGEVRQATTRIRNAMLATLRSAREATGMSLPGRMPHEVAAEEAARAAAASDDDAQTAEGTP